jgi:colanic acid/amylovoran biosynthesis glycosyltransferase
MPRLAVFTPQLGRISETFIRRHVEDLLPGQTIAVAQQIMPAGADDHESTPALMLDRWRRHRAVRLAARLRLWGPRVEDAIVAQFLRRHDVRVALGEYLDEFVRFVPMLNRLGIPFVVQGHGIDLSAALRRPGVPEQYEAYRSAQAVLTRCEFHRRRLIALGLSADRVHVNPGGVDVPETAAERGAESSKRFLAIGRLVPKKGPLLLLEAFRMAASRDAQIVLDVLGSGPLLQPAREFVDASGLGNRVRLHGAAPSDLKERLFEACGVFVQHSLTDPETGDEEGLPAAIQEAMAHAMAVISTRHAGIPDAVEDGGSGWLVDEGDVQGMAAAMIRAAADPYATAAAGRQGHTRARGRYTWAHERGRLLGHIEAATGGAFSPRRTPPGTS